jgi:hypothetical protein
MASNAETIEITQALFALWASVMATQQALQLLTPSESEEFAEHLKNAEMARDQCLEHLQKLINIFEKRRE